MALKQGMPIRDESRKDDEHSTTYSASRGGWYPTEEKPVPGQPKK